MKAELLLDTCALIWAAGDTGSPGRLAEILNLAYEAGENVWVSPISAWEIGILAKKERHATTRPPLLWFEETCARAGLKEAALDARVLIASTDLPGEIHKDPADRILVATARENLFRIVTRDRLILDYAKRGHVLAVAC